MKTKVLSTAHEVIFGFNLNYAKKEPLSVATAESSP